MIGRICQVTFIVLTVLHECGDWIDMQRLKYVQPGTKSSFTSAPEVLLRTREIRYSYHMNSLQNHMKYVHCIT